MQHAVSTSTYSNPLFPPSPAGDTSSSLFLSLQKGDLILLDDANTGETVLTSGWCSGTCERTGEHGDFPADNVYVLPCVNRPPDDILVI